MTRALSLGPSLGPLLERVRATPAFPTTPSKASRRCLAGSLGAFH